MSALFAAPGIALAAEIGDRSMLLAAALGTRYPARLVLLALVIEASLVMAIAVVVGSVAEELLPSAVTGVGAGLLFIAFGVWCSGQAQGCRGKRSALRWDERRSDITTNAGVRGVPYGLLPLLLHGQH